MDDAASDSGGRRVRVTEHSISPSAAARDPECIPRLVEARLLLPGPDGRNEAGDLHQVRLIHAFEDASVSLQELAAAELGGRA